MKTVKLNLQQYSYPIYIGSNLFQDHTLLKNHIRGQQVLIVTDEHVAPLYLAALEAHLHNNYSIDSLILPAGEQYKTWNTLNLIYDVLLQKQHDRTTTLLALGGGVTGDMTGFAASTYRRGVDFIQLPTTLLAQVDASVGGKTAINHPLGKNMIGAFYQPRCVIIDTTTLKTLPSREFNAGLAEVIKYGLIIDADFFAWLEQNMHKLLAQDVQALNFAIHRCCEIKANIVAADEKELGQRALLNLGHTFAHAIETATNYCEWLHGEAVAIGIALAVGVSVYLQWLTPGDGLRIKTLLQQAQLPIHLPTNVTIEQMIDLMALDKKVMNKQLRLVLLKGIGKGVISNEVDAALLKQILIE